MSRRAGVLAFCTLGLLLSAAKSAALAQANAPSPDKPLAMRILETPSGTRYGIFGDEPNVPAPTLFVFATSVEDMNRLRVYSEAGRQLAGRGWIYVTLDPPCHGVDQVENEPPALAGWAHRIKNGKDLVGPFVRRCLDVVDHLVRTGYTDPRRIAACGTSRGGFCALHFAAAEPRVRAVAGVSPVTNLLALREFEGVTEKQVRDVNVARLADRLAGRAIWLSIGDHDERVSTDDCVSTARELMAAAKKRKTADPGKPIELIVSPTDGHRAIADAYLRAARFIEKHVAREPR